MALRLAQLNVEADRHTQEVKRLLAENYDVVHLQEVFEVDAREWASEYGYHYHFAPLIIFDRPDAVFSPRGAWGIAILTKLPLLNPTVAYYRDSLQDVKSQLVAHDYPRALISAQVVDHDVTYTFATTHFTWAMPEDADRVQAPDLVRMMELLSKMPSFVFSGDLNAPRDQLVQQQLAEKYPYYIPDSVTTTIDNGLHRAAPLELVVDHLFATPDYQVTEVEIKSGYSDHCAVFATINKQV